MSIKVGDYVIMNNSDKPCTRLIAQVIELPEGKDFVRGRYICKGTNMRYPQGRLSEATLVSDFGVELFFTGGHVFSEQVNPSAATYRDGRPREWQPGGENPEQELWKVNSNNRIRENLGRWRFSVTLRGEETVYLNADGQEVDESDAEAFVGNDLEASLECLRRDIIYEEAHEGNRVSGFNKHSLGLIEQTLYTKPDEAVNVC